MLMFSSLSGKFVKTYLSSGWAVFLIWTVWLIVAGYATARRLLETVIPPVPSSGLLDEDDVLKDDPAINSRLIMLLQDLEERHSYRLIVVLERWLIRTAAQDFASSAQLEWLPEGGGLVVVFEWNTGNMGFRRGLNGIEMIDNECDFPSFALTDIVTTAFRSANEAEAPVVSIERAIT